MKAFEKWNRELPMREDETDFTVKTFQERRRTWRAALEWYKRTMDEITVKDIGISGQEVIDEELGDK